MKLTDDKDTWRREGRQVMVLCDNDEVFLSQADLVCMLAELQADALRRGAEAIREPRAEVPEEHVFIHGGLKGSQLVPKAELPSRADLAEAAIERSATKAEPRKAKPRTDAERAFYRAVPADSDWLVPKAPKPDHVPVSDEEEAAIDKAVFADSPSVRWSHDAQGFVRVEDSRVDPGCSGACVISPHTCDEKCGWQSWKSVDPKVRQEGDTCRHNQPMGDCDKCDRTGSHW